jgi:hypothetical protein
MPPISVGPSSVERSWSFLCWKRTPSSALRRSSVVTSSQKYGFPGRPCLARIVLVPTQRFASQSSSANT